MSSILQLMRSKFANPKDNEVLWQHKRGDGSGQRCTNTVISLGDRTCGACGREAPGIITGIICPICKFVHPARKVVEFFAQHGHFKCTNCVQVTEMIVEPNSRFTVPLVSGPEESRIPGLDLTNPAHLLLVSHLGTMELATNQNYGGFYSVIETIATGPTRVITAEAFRRAIINAVEQDHISNYFQMAGTLAGNQKGGRVAQMTTRYNALRLLLDPRKGKNGWNEVRTGYSNLLTKWEYWERKNFNLGDTETVNSLDNMMDSLDQVIERLGWRQAHGTGLSQAQHQALQVVQQSIRAHFTIPGEAIVLDMIRFFNQNYQNNRGLRDALYVYFGIKPMMNDMDELITLLHQNGRLNELRDLFRGSPLSGGHSLNLPITAAPASKPAAIPSPTPAKLDRAEAFKIIYRAVPFDGDEVKSQIVRYIKGQEPGYSDAVILILELNLPQAEGQTKEAALVSACVNTPKWNELLELIKHTGYYEKTGPTGSQVNWVGVGRAIYYTGKSVPKYVVGTDVDIPFGANVEEVVVLEKGAFEGHLNRIIVAYNELVIGRTATFQRNSVIFTLDNNLIRIDSDTNRSGLEIREVRMTDMDFAGQRILRNWEKQNRDK
jgi:hypothetical protein